MEFSSMEHFAGHLAHLAAAETLALHKGLEKCAMLVEKTAKAEIGTYQTAAGPFQDWAELADVTQEERERLGFTPNDPLERSGELGESITHETELLEAVIGSTSPVMEYMEFGTPTTPPRPVLGPAMFRNKEKIRKIIGGAAISGLVGGAAIHASLGYDMEVEK